MSNILQTRKSERRSFMKRFALLTSGGLFTSGNLLGKPGFEPVAENANHLSVIESGIYGKEPVFVMGMLYSARSSAIHEAAIEALRVDYNYKSRLTYGSTDRYKVKFADAIIAYFSKAEDLFFTAKVFRFASKPNKEVNNPSSFSIVTAKLGLYQSFFENLPDKDNAYNEVLVKPTSPFGPSGFFREQFQSETNKELIAIDARKSQLLQLNDLLTGCVAGDIRGGVRNANKKQLLMSLKEAVSVKSFNKNVSRSNFKIRF